MAPHKHRPLFHKIARVPVPGGTVPLLVKRPLAVNSFVAHSHDEHGELVALNGMLSAYKTKTVRLSLLLLLPIVVVIIIFRSRPLFLSLTLAAASIWFEIWGVVDPVKKI